MSPSVPRRSLPAILQCMIIALLMVLSGTLSGQEPDPAVEAGRQALRNSASYPWYDSETDNLRDLNAKTKQEEDTQTRKTGWEWDVPQAKPSPFTWRPPSWSWIIQYTAMTLLAILIVVLVVLLLRYFLKEEEGAAASAEFKFEDKKAEIDRVEQLPFAVRRPGGDLLSEARALYEQGRYGEAMIYLYSYELVQLDRHQHIHLTKGKTNRQYLREIRSAPTLRSVLHRSMIAFEDFFFGHHDLDRQRFEECWQRLDEFHGALEQGALA